MPPSPIVNCVKDPVVSAAPWYTLDIDYADSEYVSTNAGPSFWFGTFAQAKAAANACANCPGFWADSTNTDENSTATIRYYMIATSAHLNSYIKPPAKSWPGLMWFKPTIPRPVGL
jgi:hypothetical protein